MIDIYDEVGYIKNVLGEGLSYKWQRDAILLIRYYKMEGLKKSVAKQKIKEKCEMAATRNHDRINYNPLTDYKKFNSMFEKAWKTDTQLRSIHQVEFSKEVLDWFLNLEDSRVFTNEEYEYYQKRRPKCKVSKISKKPLNWNRVKYLFTVYIWTKIQEQYLDKPNVHYISKFAPRFKHDANLADSFNLINERNFLSDLGYIRVNFALGVEPAFMENFDVFKIPVTDENRVVIETGEIWTGDLYNPGKWLDKQKYGFYVCENCGKEIVYNKGQVKSKSKGGRPRKYCPECSDLIRHGKTGETREVTCVDCGKVFEVSSHDCHTERCYNCSYKYRANYLKDKIQERKEHKEHKEHNSEGQM